MADLVSLGPRTPTHELLDYIDGEIQKIVAERSVVIDRLFQAEREAHGREWERIRNQRSQAIHDLEIATLPLRRRWIAIAETLAGLRGG